MDRSSEECEGGEGFGVAWHRVYMLCLFLLSVFVSIDSDSIYSAAHKADDEVIVCCSVQSEREAVAAHQNAAALS